MIDWIKNKLRLRRALKAYKKEVKNAEFDRMTGQYLATQDCKHAVRIAHNLNDKEEEVRCMHCGLIKIIPRLKN